MEANELMLGEGVHNAENQLCKSTPLTPEIFAAAGWEEAKVRHSNCREFDFYEEYDDGYINAFEVQFWEKSNLISINYSHKKTTLKVVKPNPISVGEFNTLLDIVKLEKFKIK